MLLTLGATQRHFRRAAATKGENVRCASLGRWTSTQPLTRWVALSRERVIPARVPEWAQLSAEGGSLQSRELSICSSRACDHPHEQHVRIHAMSNVDVDEVTCTRIGVVTSKARTHACFIDRRTQ